MKSQNIFTHSILLLLISSLNCFSQISSPFANYTTSLSYTVSTDIDSLFVFYSSNNANDIGSLSATGPGSGNYNYDWYKYNELTDSYVFLNSELNLPSSSKNGLTEGGYQVRVFNGVDFDQTFRAWIYIDKLSLEIKDKDGSGKLLSRQFSCYELRLNGIITMDPYYYYDPVSHEEILLDNDSSFLWTSDNPDLIIPFASRDLFPNQTSRPPYIDTWYYLTVHDIFGMTAVDSVLYESISVKSEFSFQLFDKIDTETFIDPPDPAEGPAPLLVKFINESQNGFNFTWIYDASKNSDISDVETTTTFEYQPEYTYYRPDDYYPSLAAESEEGCLDTFKLKSPIKVLESILNVPNVFTPNNDDINDYFTVKHQSLKEFHVRIYSRTGHWVYKDDITDVNEWEGWDGNIMNSGRPALPGAYYYVIEATGWDEIRYNKGPYKGVVYLYRAK
jgi:gliding motility-associated-like protein